MRDKAAVLLLTLVALVLASGQGWPSDSGNSPTGSSILELATHVFHGHPTYRSPAVLPSSGLLITHAALSVVEHDLAPPPHAHARLRTRF